MGVGLAIAGLVVSAYGILSGKTERDKASDRARRIMATYGMAYGEAMKYAASLEESAGMWENYAAQSQATISNAGVYMDVSDIYQDSVRVAIESDRFMKNQELQMLKNGIDMVGTPLLVLQETMNAGEMELEALDKRAENTLKLQNMNYKTLMLSGKVKELQGKQKSISTREQAQAEQIKALSV